MTRRQALAAMAAAAVGMAAAGAALAREGGQAAASGAADEVALKPLVPRVTKAVIDDRGEDAEAVGCAAGQTRTFAVEVELPDWPMDLVVSDALDRLLTPVGLVGCQVDGSDVECAWSVRGNVVTMAPDLSGVAWGSARTLRVEFDATLSAEATSGHLDNDAELLSNGAKVAGSNVVTLHWGLVRIAKTDDGATTRLAGATFRAAASLEDAKAGSFMTRGGSEWAATTGGDGTCEFAGIAVDPREGAEVWVVETQAPQGYKPVAEPFLCQLPAGGTGGDEHVLTVWVHDAPEDSSGQSGATPAPGGNLPKTSDETPVAALAATAAVGAALVAAGAVAARSR